MDVKELQTVIILTVIIQDKMSSSNQNIELSCMRHSVGLLMTYSCNLNCKYCYITDKRNRDMSFEMAQTILEPFLYTEGELLTIAFMGGETLLAFETIRKVIDWILTKKWNRPYRFFGSTNGTLLNDEMRLWLNKHSKIFTLGLSYDGIPSTQLKNRGIDNIDIDFFLSTWPKQPIQMTINEESVYKMADGIIYLLEKGAVVHPNVAFESSEWSDKAITEYGRQLSILIDFYKANPTAYPISPLIHDLNYYAYCIDHPQPQLEICGAGNGFEVFDINGKSYPCHILSPLVLKGEKLKKIKRGLINSESNFADSDCFDCPYSIECPTCIGCNYLYRGRINKRDKTHCKIMKVEVMAAIKMEVEKLKLKDEFTPHDASLVDSITKIIEYQKKQKIRSSDCNRHNDA